MNYLKIVDINRGWGMPMDRMDFLKYDFKAKLFF